MRPIPIHELKKHQHKKRIPDWFVYLPGAVILCYGLWLSLTV